MKIALLAFLVIVLLASCDNSEYPDYAKTKNGHVKIHKIGDDDFKIKNGDNVLLKYEFRTINEQILYQCTPDCIDPIVLYNINAKDGGLASLLYGNIVGDSLSFIVNKELILSDTIDLSANTDSIIKCNVIILRRETRRRFLYRLKQNREMKARLIKEGIDIENYVDTTLFDKSNYRYGIYFIEEKRGTGASIRKGDVVSVHYVGKFLDGTRFDDTRRNNAPFTFTKGDPEQVLAGFEIGVELMKKGGKAKFIIPSRLGFGEKGSTTGIIPPFATLVYDVEIIDVR